MLGFITLGFGSCRQAEFGGCRNGFYIVKRFTLEDLAEQTAGVNCRKDDGVLDEIPGSYKDIDIVMENQKDLVETVAVLKQIMCVKG